MSKLEQSALSVPEGYALVSVDALKAWGKYDEVSNACKFPAEQAEQEPVEQHTDRYWLHEINNARADGYERGYTAGKSAAPQPVKQEPVNQDAFAASGKPIAEQTNTQLMEGYRIGLAEMREKCAKVCDDIGDSDNGYGCAAAIRTIKFEGDTGFRPVSEMVAEHKQAEQEPVGEVVMESMGVGDAQIVRFRMNGRIPPVGTKLYAAPVRTKDLTDDEIDGVMWIGGLTQKNIRKFARAVIAAYKEKNK